MRRFFRFIVGALAALIGLVGAIFSGVAAFQAWELAERLDREIPAAVGDLERVVDSVRQQGDSTLALIDAARERVRFVGETVEEISGITERRGTTPSLLEALDPDIEQRLEAAETFIFAMQDSLRSLNRALVVLDSLPLFPRRFSPGNRPRDASLDAMAASLDEAVVLLDEASRTIARIRSGRALSPRQLAQFRELLGEVDRTLGDVRFEIEGFFLSIEQAGARLTGLRDAAPIWIERAAAVATAFFACFGASQLVLMAQGVILMALPPALRGWRVPPGAAMLAAGAPPNPGGAADRPVREAD